MSLSRLIFAFYDATGHTPSKIKLKSQYMRSLKSEFGVESSVTLKKFLGIPMEELSEGNGNMMVIED
jgi:hypothetical protein